MVNIYVTAIFSYETQITFTEVSGECTMDFVPEIFTILAVDFHKASVYLLSQDAG